MLNHYNVRIEIYNLNIRMRFRLFIENGEADEEKKDIAITLQKIPPSHASLVHGFKWKFHGGNTLNGDDQHVGYMDDGDKEIAIAAPYNYPREITILHEIAHRVWENLPREIQAKWHQVCAHLTERQKQDPSLKQSPEELFCMAYGNTYATTKLVKFDNPLWTQFIQQLPS